MPFTLPELLSISVLALIELAFLYNPSHPFTFQTTLEPPVASRCFFPPPWGWYREKNSRSWMVEGAVFQKDCVALAETHSSPIPTLHLQRDFPFTVNTVKMGKSGKKNFYLWEKCVISSLQSVGFLGCVRESTITWRDKVVEMGLLALWPTFLLCCTRSWPTPEPLLLLQLHCWLRRSYFSEIHLLPAFPLFREELSLSLTWLIIPCRVYHGEYLFLLKALWVVKIGPGL